VVHVEIKAEELFAIGPLIVTNSMIGALLASIILLLAETWAYINMCMFVFLVWRLKERDPGPAPAGAIAPPIGPGRRGRRSPR